MDRMTYVKHPHSWNRGKCPTKYTSRHTFQEVVARLAAYEDTGLEPEEIKEVQEAMEPIPFGRFRGIMEAERAGRLVLPSEPNDPLTLEELREMDGEPVWCVNGYGGQWCLVHVYSVEGNEYIECVTNEAFTMGEAVYGKMGIYAWLAYRRKPEEESR